MKFNLAMVVKDFSRYINSERNTSGNESEWFGINGEIAHGKKVRGIAFFILCFNGRTRKSKAPVAREKPGVRKTSP